MFDWLFFWRVNPTDRTHMIASYVVTFDDEPGITIHWHWPTRVLLMPEGWRRRPFDWARERWEW